MSAIINPLKFHSAKILEKGKNDRDVHAGECPIAGTNVRLNKKIVDFGTVITGGIPSKAQRSESMVLKFSSLLDMCTAIQAKKQTRILSKVRLAKDHITKLFKTNGRAYPAISNFDPLVIPYIQPHCVQDVHSSPLLLASISQTDIPRVPIVTVFDSLLSGQIRSEAVTSLVRYSERVVEEHVEDFVSILRNVVEDPSPSSPTQFLTPPESQRIPRSTFLFNELHTIEEEVGNTEVDAEGVHLGPETITVSSSCGSLTTSDSGAKYDAMLAAEFATFSFDSDDIQEWSDEVERGKQAKMDAHFAYVSKALAVPVPKLSAYFSTDSPADFTTVDKDESISEPSPSETEAFETNTSSADSSLVTNVDTEESRLQLSSTLLRGLRRVRKHEDLKRLRMITDSNDSFSDQFCWSFDLGLSDSPVLGSKAGALRRSVKCNDLRRSFLSLESGRCHTPSHEIRPRKNRLLSVWRLRDPRLLTWGLTARPQGVHFFM